MIVCNTVAIGLIVRTLLAERAPSIAVLIAFFLVALFVRASAAVLVGPRGAMALDHARRRAGLAIGSALLLLALLLLVAWRIALAGLMLMAGTVLVNLAPANPYSAVALATWK